MMVLGIFKIALRLRNRHIFMWQSKEILNDFNTLTLKQIFWKTKTFFKKLENYFLVESIKIENASFPYKTAISEEHGTPPVAASHATGSDWCDVFLFYANIKHHRFLKNTCERIHHVNLKMNISKMNSSLFSLLAILISQINHDYKDIYIWATLQSSAQLLRWIWSSVSWNQIIPEVFAGPKE